MTATGFNHRQDPVSAEEVAMPLDTDHGAVARLFHPHRTLQKDGTVSEGFTEGDVANALCGATGTKADLIADDVEVRRLTPLERERLMGFPDNWTAMVSDAQRNAQTGNAVVVPVIEWIARRLVDVDANL